MQGKVFVVGFLFVAFAFFAFASLFMLYPPAANNWLTLIGFVLYLAVAILVIRKVARK
jgi:hypothetical protein